MRYADNFNHGLFPLTSDADIFPYSWVFANLRHLAIGLPFACTLLGILLTHEFGHYFACRYYRVRATLPYMLPAPSLSGTAGAVIRLKSRVKARAALLMIGAMGPIAGFAVALGTTTIGLMLSHPVSAEPVKLVGFSTPLLIDLLLGVLNGPLHRHLNGPLLWHPVLVASWIGLLITSLNLIPAGQLDGGHILYSLSPRVHRTVTNVMLVVLVVCGLFCWMGWLLWAGLLLLPGMRHPRVPVDNTLPRPVAMLAPVTLVIFILCATPTPFKNTSLLHVIEKVRLHQPPR